MFCQEGAQREEQRMTINYCAGRRERVPVNVTVLTRNPRELLSSLSPVNIASRNTTGAGKREGNAKTLKLKRNSGQRLRLQPLDPYPIPPTIYKISRKSLPSLVLSFHTHFFFFFKKAYGEKKEELSRYLCGSSLST